MGLRISSNPSALNARRHLDNSTQLHSKSLEKLSSGLRINRAADDAAGLAISESLKVEVRTLDQAARNAADGISLVQTAEGSLDEVSGILVRMKELAVQALNGTLTNPDRSLLSGEYYALRDEITRIATGAEFNGVSLLDGTGGTVAIQVGTGTTATDQVGVDLSRDFDHGALSLTAGIWAPAFAASAVSQVDDAIELVVGIRGSFGAVQNRLESAIRNINNTSENLAAANSRIRDVDVAAESSRMTSRQIVQQAGVAMLAQSNNLPQLALSLLQ